MYEEYFYFCVMYLLLSVTSGTIPSTLLRRESLSD